MADPGDRSPLAPGLGDTAVDGVEGIGVGRDGAEAVGRELVLGIDDDEGFHSGREDGESWVGSGCAPGLQADGLPVAVVWVLSFRSSGGGEEQNAGALLDEGVG